MISSKSATYGSLLFICLAAALLGSAPLSLEGQVNVEALRRDDPPLGRSGTLGGDLVIKTGNVDFVQIAFGARMYRVSESATTLLVGDGGIGLLGGSRFASSGLFHFRQTFGPDRRISPEWYGQINYDRSQLLDFRMVAGAGGRTSFARGEWGQFGAGSALMLEYERLDLPETALHKDQTAELRWSNFATLRVVAGQNLVVTSTTYVQPVFGDFGDVRMLENLRIATSVTDALAITISFDLRYDSRPPDDIGSLDTSLRTGVTYTY